MTDNLGVLLPCLGYFFELVGIINLVRGIYLCALSLQKSPHSYFLNYGLDSFYCID